MSILRENPPMTVAEIQEAHANGQIFTSHGYKYQFAYVRPDNGLTVEECKGDWPYNAYDEVNKLVAECGKCLVVFDRLADDDPREARNLGA